MHKSQGTSHALGSSLWLYRGWWRRCIMAMVVQVFVFLKTVLLPKFLESDYFNKLQVPPPALLIALSGCCMPDVPCSGAACQAAITLEHVNGSLGDDALGAGPRSSPPPASTAGDPLSHHHHHQTHLPSPTHPHQFPTRVLLPC